MYLLGVFIRRKIETQRKQTNTETNKEEVYINYFKVFQICLGRKKNHDNLYVEHNLRMINRET